MLVECSRMAERLVKMAIAKELVQGAGRLVGGVFKKHPMKVLGAGVGVGIAGQGVKPSETAKRLRQNVV